MAGKKTYERPVARSVHIKFGSYDVYIGRQGGGSKWQNPYRLGRAASWLEREVCILRYCDHLQCSPELLEEVRTLRGQRLGCHCKPLACHGDVLAELAESDDDPRAELRRLIAHRARFLCDVSTPGITKPWLIVSGSRALQDMRLVRERLEGFPVAPHGIIHGGCYGADTLGGAWAAETGIAEEVYPATDHGAWPGAGPKRNRAMLGDARAQAFLAFWDGKTERSGTLDFVRAAAAQSHWVAWREPVDHRLIEWAFYGLHVGLLLRRQVAMADVAKGCA